jgi:hypothetical protein
VVRPDRACVNPAEARAWAAGASGLGHGPPRPVGGVLSSDLVK